MPDETEQLTAAMSCGDRQAVAAFYERYFDLLFRSARSAARGRDEHFCLDVVHDAVLRIVRTIKPVASERQLMAWLRLVVQSVAYDLLRREQRRTKREKSHSPGGALARASAMVSGGSDVPDRIGLAEQIDWLRNELQKLDPRLVELIELRYDQKWTLAAIGARFGVSAGTVDGRLRRALDHLRERAQEVHGESGIL